MKESKTATKSTAKKVKAKKPTIKKEVKVEPDRIAVLKEANLTHFMYKSDKHTGIEKRYVTEVNGKDYLVETGEKFGVFNVILLIGNNLGPTKKHLTKKSLEAFLGL
jgi:hypothetical protein